MTAKFQLELRSNHQFMFNLKAPNGEIILTSESYTEKENALAGIESVRVNAANDACYERKIAKNKQSFFVLKAANHEIIGKSEMYTSPSAMENGIASVKKSAPLAVLEGIAEKVTV